MKKESIKHIVLFCTVLLFSCTEKSKVAIVAMPEYDVEFENSLVGQKIDTDGIINGKITNTRLDTVQSLIFYKSIQSYVGIELFPNLKTLYVIFNASDVKDLDLSKNNKLENIVIEANSPSSIRLNIQKCLNLKYLKTKKIDLSNIDFKIFDKLESLEIYNDGFTLNTLDLNKNVLLKFLKVYSSSSYLKLGIEKCENLESLILGVNNLSNLDFNNFQKLTKISVEISAFYPVDTKTLDISNLSALKELSYKTPSVENIILPKTSNIEIFTTYSVGLNNSVLNLEGQKKITAFSLYGNTIKEIQWDSGNMNYLKYVLIDASPVENLNLLGFKNLAGIEITNLNNLSEINISGSVNIGAFYSRNNPNLKKICLNSFQKIDTVSSFTNGGGSFPFPKWYKDNKNTYWGVCK